MVKPQLKVFNKAWLKGGTLDAIATQMLNGQNLEGYKRAVPVICTMGDMPSDKPVALFDFGCGLGRGLYHIGRRFNNWKVIGYDHESVVKRIPEVWGDQLPSNAKYTGDWDEAWGMVMNASFGDVRQKEGLAVIYCDLVLQHLEFDTLRAVVSEFRKIVDARGGGLIVHGRRCLDDMRTQVWPVILEHFSLDWIHGPQTLQSLYGGDPKEHIVAVFMTKILD